MVGAFLLLDVFGLALLSRFSVRLGLVTLRQRFVRRCQGMIFLLARVLKRERRKPIVAGWRVGVRRVEQLGLHQRPILALTQSVASHPRMLNCFGLNSAPGPVFNVQNSQPKDRTFRPPM